MPASKSAVVQIQPTETARAASVLAAAFSGDEHTVGLLPKKSRGNPSVALNRLFSQLISENSGSKGYAEFGLHPITKEPSAVALWELPESLEGQTSLVDVLSYLRVFGYRVFDAARTEYNMKKNRPKEPHLYLSVLGTQPSARGHGIGDALIRSGLLHADRIGVGVYLESSSRGNVAYYQRHGFIEGTPISAYGTIQAIGMWRPPAM